MRGRLFGVKKSYILRAVIILMLLSTIASSLACILVLKIYDLWFFNICLALGIFQMTKAMLFKLDSCLYLGSLLILIGTSGYVFWLTKTLDYAIFYISLAFAISSIFTFIKCGQKFHLVFAFSTIFVTLFGLLVKKNLITLPIFIAFVGSFLLLLILEITIFFKRRK